MTQTIEYCNHLIKDKRLSKWEIDLNNGKLIMCSKCTKANRKFGLNLKFTAIISLITVTLWAFSVSGLQGIFAFLFMSLIFYKFFEEDLFLETFLGGEIITADELMSGYRLGVTQAAVGMFLNILGMFLIGYGIRDYLRLIRGEKE